MGFEARADDFFDSASPADDGSILLARKQQRDHEIALADTGSPFASLGCFRTRPPLRKKPVLVVSDEEMAEAHQAFETGAATLVEVEEPVLHKHVDFLGLSGMGEEDDPDENMGADVTDDLDTGEDLDAIAALNEEVEIGAEEAMPLAVERPALRKSMALPPVSEEERQADISEINAREAEGPGADPIAPEGARPTPMPAPPPPPPARTMNHLLRGSSEDQDGDAPSAVASLFERMRQQSGASVAPRAPAAVRPLSEIAGNEAEASAPQPEADEPPSILEQMARMRALPQQGEGEMQGSRTAPVDAAPVGDTELPERDDRASDAASSLTAPMSAEELFADEAVVHADEGMPPLDLVKPGFAAIPEPYDPPAVAPPPEIAVADGYDAPVEQAQRSKPRNSLRARIIREETQSVEVIPEPPGMLTRLWNWIAGKR